MHMLCTFPLRMPKIAAPKYCFVCIAVVVVVVVAVVVVVVELNILFA